MMLGVATVGLAATGRVATNGGSVGTPLTTCSNGGSAGTPLIGYERWHCLHKGKPEVLDAFYATPNPSIHVPPLPLPDGQWHIVWSHRLLRKWQEWIDSPLVEEETLYLKGGCTGPKGNYHTEARARARAHRHVNDSEHCCQKPALFVLSMCTALFPWGGHLPHSTKGESPK